MFTYNLCSGMLRSIGNSMMPLVFLIISSVLNIILDIILITQFNLGIKGAAIATVISQAIASALITMKAIPDSCKKDIAKLLEIKEVETTESLKVELLPIEEKNQESEQTERILID
jgi:Na+-driven multidrug efflux pump